MDRYSALVRSYSDAVRVKRSQNFRRHFPAENIGQSLVAMDVEVPAKTPGDDGSVQLQNIGRSTGYFNHRPPRPTLHHYIFEVYALDQKLDPSISTRADLLKAMAGHVKAKGTYLGTYHQ